MKKEMELKDFVVGKEYRRVIGTNHTGKVGDIYKCKSIRDNGEVELKRAGGAWCSVTNNQYEQEPWTPRAFEPVDPVEQPLQYGDKVTVNRGVLSYIYLMTTPTGEIITTNAYNMDKLEDDYSHLEVFNWGTAQIIKKVEPVVVDTTREVTLSDIAKAMNINVKDLKIVD